MHHVHDKEKFLTKVFNKSSERTKRKRLRSNMPLPEVILWSKLRCKGLGYKFRRQYSVEAFVVDFCCLELRLAIEVDGDSHYTEDAIIRDKERQRIIEHYGFTFLRFTNREVYDNIDGVLAMIMRRIGELTLTSPTPPCQGGDLNQ